MLGSEGCQPAVFGGPAEHNLRRVPIYGLREETLRWGPAGKLPAAAGWQPALLGSNGTRALPKHSQAEIENRDQRHAHQETCQNKFLSMLQHFSKHRVRSQIEKSAAYMRHD